MGLDWCLRRKPRPGCALRASDLQETIALNQQEMTSIHDLVHRGITAMNPKSKCEERYDYTHRIQTLVEKDPDIIKLSDKRMELEKEEAGCYIYPRETIYSAYKAPLGVTEQLLDYLLEKCDTSGNPNYKMYHLFSDVENTGLTRNEVREVIGASWDDFCALEAYPELKERIPDEAFPRVSGMLVGEFDFRGKCIARNDIVPGDLQDKAHADMSPDQAVLYGVELLTLAKDIDAPIHDVAEEDWEKWVIRKAGAWLIFWGEAGHGVHAWY